MLAELEYKRLHLKLTIFFERRGFHAAAIEADEVIWRAALQAGSKEVKNWRAFLFEVARIRLFEIIRRKAQEPIQTGNLDLTVQTKSRQTVRNLSFTRFLNDEDRRKQGRFECLDHCMALLPERDQTILMT